MYTVYTVTTVIDYTVSIDSVYMYKHQLHCILIAWKGYSLNERSPSTTAHSAPATLSVLLQLAPETGFGFGV